MSKNEQIEIKNTALREALRCIGLLRSCTIDALSEEFIPDTADYADRVRDQIREALEK